MPERMKDSFLTKLTQESVVLLQTNTAATPTFYSTIRIFPYQVPARRKKFWCAAKKPRQASRLKNRRLKKSLKLELALVLFVKPNKFLRAQILGANRGSEATIVIKRLFFQPVNDPQPPCRLTWLINF